MSSSFSSGPTIETLGADMTKPYLVSTIQEAKDPENPGRVLLRYQVNVFDIDPKVDKIYPKLEFTTLAPKKKTNP